MISLCGLLLAATVTTTSTAPLSYDDLDGLDLILEQQAYEFDDPDYLDWHQAVDVGITLYKWADAETWKGLGD